MDDDFFRIKHDDDLPDDACLTIMGPDVSLMTS
jgi:hypothetical protein